MVKKVLWCCAEAQVMLCTCLSGPPRTTSSALYVKALMMQLREQIAINMSLGSSTGSMVVWFYCVDAIKRAQGVSVLISTGNMATFGNGYSKPLAENQTMACEIIHC